MGCNELIQGQLQGSRLPNRPHEQRCFAETFQHFVPPFHVFGFSADHDEEAAGLRFGKAPEDRRFEIVSYARSNLPTERDTFRWSNRPHLNNRPILNVGLPRREQGFLYGRRIGQHEDGALRSLDRLRGRPCPEGTPLLKGRAFFFRSVIHHDVMAERHQPLSHGCPH